MVFTHLFLSAALLAQPADIPPTMVKESTPTITSAQILDTLILYEVDGQGRINELHWTSNPGELDLTWEDEWISDLDTFEDQYGNIAFEGLFDGQGVPAISGYIVPLPSGDVDVFIDAPDEAPFWYTADDEGVPTEKRKCLCAGGPAYCASNSDCRNNEPCPGGNCAWVDVSL